MTAFVQLFEQRFRGIRLIELIGLGLALAMIFGVCLSKARESEDKRREDQLNQQIADQQAAVDALKIKVAALERPARIEALAKTYLGMTPVAPTHEARLDSLGEISHTTSRPVQVGPVTASSPPVTTVTPGATDNSLISTQSNKGSNAPAPVTVAAKSAGGKL